jgi:hypothetical protein
MEHLLWPSKYCEFGQFFSSLYITDTAITENTWSFSPHVYGTSSLNYTYKINCAIFGNMKRVVLLQAFNFNVI